MKKIIPSNKLPKYIWAKCSNNGQIILEIYLYEPFIDKEEGQFNFLKKIKIKKII